MECYKRCFGDEDLGYIVKDAGSDVFTLQGLHTFNSLPNVVRALLVTEGDVRPYLEREDALNERIAAAALDEALVARLVQGYRDWFVRPDLGVSVKFVPHLQERLETLSQTYTLGVLSNTTPDALDRDMGYLAPLFDFMLPLAQKPSAARLVEELGSLGVPAAQCLYVGDAKSDVALARECGAASAGLLTGQGTAAMLAGADIVLDDFEALFHLLTSPELLEASNDVDECVPWVDLVAAAASASSDDERNKEDAGVTQHV